MSFSSQKPRRGAALMVAAALSGPASAGPPANALPVIPFSFQQSIRPYAGPGAQGFQNNAGGLPGAAPTYSTGVLGGAAVGTVTLNATRTILDWTRFQVGANARLDFLFPGATPGAIAGDIVINRLQGASAIDIAGVVEGLTSDGTQTGGQLWFLAPGGVIFEKGSTVAAGRIVAANAFTTTNANDVAFLSATGDDAALMRHGGGLIDLRGAVSASGASLDATGAILITGDVNTGATGSVDLESTGTISADGGAITAGTLTGSSVGGASFANPANDIGAIATFSNSGTGNVAFMDNTPGLALQLGNVENHASGAGSGSISVTQVAGDVIQSLVQGQDTVLQANGDISVSVPAGRLNARFILAGGDIAIDAERFISETSGALEAGGSLSITLADPNGLVLADSEPAAGLSSWINPGSLQASAVTVTQTDPSGMVVGDATVVGNLQAASVNPGAPQSASLTLLTPGPVTITGHLLPASGVTADLTIGQTSGGGLTPSIIEILNDTVAPASGSANLPPGGSIGAGQLNPNGTYSGVQAFGAVTLAARSDILAGTSAFDAANLNSSTAAAQANPLLNVPDAGAPNLSGGVLIAANTLTVQAGVAILQQNTSGLATSGGSGLFSGVWIGASGAGALTLAPNIQSGPAAFDLYGVLGGATGAPIAGAAAATSGLISTPQPPAGSFYRFNGCPIGEAGGCGGAAAVLAHVVSPLGLPTPPIFGTGVDGDPPVVGPVAVDLWRRNTASPDALRRLSDAELLGVLTREVEGTLTTYGLDPDLCYDVDVLGRDIYDQLLKSDTRGVTGRELDLALRQNDTSLRDVIDQGVSEAAQQTAVYCQSRAEAAPPPDGTAPPVPVIEPARFGEVMARARDALDRVPPKILVAVRHR
jgi:filamentous hemagglutinin family protein